MIYMVTVRGRIAIVEAKSTAEAMEKVEDALDVRTSDIFEVEKLTLTKGPAVIWTEDLPR